MEENLNLTDEQFAKALRALSENNRLEIVRRLMSKSCDEGVICTAILSQLTISQSTFSHHVSALREAGIILAEPEGRTVQLRLNRPLMKEIARIFTGLS